MININILNVKSCGNKKRGFEDTWRRLSTHPEQVMDLAAIVIFFSLKSLQRVTNNTIEGLFQTRWFIKALTIPAFRIWQQKKSAFYHFYHLSWKAFDKFSYIYQKFPGLKTLVSSSIIPLFVAKPGGNKLWRKFFTLGCDAKMRQIETIKPFFPSQSLGVCHRAVYWGGARASPS